MTKADTNNPKLKRKTIYAPFSDRDIAFNNDNNYPALSEKLLPKTVTNVLRFACGDMSAGNSCLNLCLYDQDDFTKTFFHQTSNAYPDEAILLSGYPVTKNTPISLITSRLELVKNSIINELTNQAADSHIHDPQPLIAVIKNTVSLLENCSPLDNEGLYTLKTIHEFISQTTPNVDIEDLKLIIKYCADNDKKPAFVSPTQSNEGSDLSPLENDLETTHSDDSKDTKNTIPTLDNSSATDFFSDDVKRPAKKYKSSRTIKK
jgi:hypothetical protein